MRRWMRLLAALLWQLPSVYTMQMTINQKDANRQVCSGMYSRKSWGGTVDPFILVKFVPPTDSTDGREPIVSLVVFESRDRLLVGKPDPRDATVADYLCDEGARDAGLCLEADLGKFILADNATEASKSPIRTEAIHLKDPSAINYPVKKTGYYCVSSAAYTADDYTGTVEFRNAFGELPATQIVTLPFYAALTLIYAFIAMAWSVLYWMYRRDILAVQNYITAILVFLVFEMFMIWLSYDYTNRNGASAGSLALMVAVGVLSAARNSYTFFLLLIVCMGYGVVKHDLGKVMWFTRALAVAHFVFGVFYGIVSITAVTSVVGSVVLLVVLPLAATLTTFYIWTLNSLNYTMKDLVQRKQHAKAAMYRKLWWCILTSIIVIFAFFFVNSWTFAGSSSPEFYATHWQSQWFTLDGWLDLVYLFDLAFIVYIWRPTANNRRFAMSDEIAQDDDGFEIASIRDSMDLDDDLEAVGANGSKAPPAYDPHQYAGSSNPLRDASPLPAPKPTKPAHLPRESLDGETIFAVDEDSEDDDDVEESKRLTGKSD